MKNYPSIAIISSLLISPCSAYAATFIPHDLKPGDSYKLVFVTSTFTNARSNNIADYNNHVQSAFNHTSWANEMNNSGVCTDLCNWFAIASTSSVNARDNTQTNPVNVDHPDVPIYLVNGDGASITGSLAQVASSKSDLWDGLLNSPINLTEKGTTPEDNINNVWTGTGNNGTVHHLFGLGSVLRLAGMGTSFSQTDWITTILSILSLEKRIYAMSEALTVPKEEATTIPEPKLLFSFILLEALMLGKGQKRK
jgi:hypothetical protein